MIFVSTQDEFNFMSDKDVREEYEYIMAVSEIAQFVVKYGVEKVIHDMSLCASAIMNPRNFGPDQE